MGTTRSPHVTVPIDRGGRWPEFNWSSTSTSLPTTSRRECCYASHTGCDKFVQRFGIDATKFVKSATGRALNLRGINARVIEPGPTRRGDVIAVVAAGGASGP